MISYSPEGEEYKKEIYTIHNLINLLKYIKPYWWILVFAGFVLIASTLVDIMIPYVTKQTIDNYITPQWTYLRWEREEITLPKGSFIPIKEDLYLLNLTLLDKPTISKLEKEGKISKERVIILKEVSPQFYEKYKEQIQLVKGEENIYLIPYSNLKNFDPNDLKRVRGENLRGTLKMASFILLLFFISFVLNFVIALLLQYSGQKAIHRLRLDLVNHILRLPVNYFDKNPVGKITTRVTNDLAAIHEMYAGVLVYFAKDIMLVIGVFIILFRLNPKLSFVLSSLIPFVFISAYLFQVYARDAFRKVRFYLAKINAFVQETLQGIPIIQVFLAEKKAMKKFGDINEDLYRANIRQLYVFAIFRPLVDFFGTLAVALIIWYGTGEILRGTLTFGAFVAFLAYMEMFFAPIRDLAEKYNIVQSAMASSERIFQIFSLKPEHMGKLKNIKINGKIEFQGVWFSYEENPKDSDWVLKDVSFCVNPGEKVAIVGPTGSGKTSIISLILCFYKPQKGKILIDDIDINEFDLDFLRANIAMVFQDIYLFSGTVEENLTMWEGKGNGGIKKALEITQLDELLKSKNNSLQTYVGERGSFLSQGERQLLSLARALIKVQSPIVLLDEATASVDSLTEYLIENSIKELLGGKTSIIIAHRFSTIKNVDKIIVLLNGQVKEMGTHEELMEKRGIYYTLYSSQFNLVLKS